MSDQQTLLPGPRISRVTLGRLHNLGNYEHVRYEVTVELPPGTSPASVIHELEQTLNGLEPKSPISAWELRTALEDLKRQGIEPEDDRTRERARERITRHDQWRKQRDAALRRFNQFGGSEVWTDAKDNWDDEVPF